MPSRSVQVATAIVTLINGATLPQPVTAVRSWLPESALEGLAPVRCDVFPRSQVQGALSRGEASFEIETAVAIQKQAIGTAAVDPLVELLEAIGVLLDRTPLPGMSTARYRGQRFEPIASVLDLKDKNLYVGLLIVTHVVYEEIS